jgi:hypothetical protein
MKNEIQGIIRLSGQKIDNQIVSCTGLQLAKILKAFPENLNEYQWLIADISTNDGVIPKLVSNIDG